MDKTKVVSAVSTSVVAVAAGLISYQHIEDLTLSLGQTLLAARLMPVAIDGMIATGSMSLIKGGRIGWIGLGPGIVLSLFANIASGVSHGVLGAAWAGAASVSFALSSIILERTFLNGADTATAAQSATETVAEPATAVTAPETVTEAPAAAARPRRASKPKPPERGTLDLRGAELAFASHLKEGRLPGLTLIRKTMHCGHAAAAEYQEHLRGGLVQEVTA